MSVCSCRGFKERTNESSLNRVPVRPGRVADVGSAVPEIQHTSGRIGEWILIPGALVRLANARMSLAQSAPSVVHEGVQPELSAEQVPHEVGMILASFLIRLDASTDRFHTIQPSLLQ